MELDAEPPDTQEKLMDDETFEQEAALAAAGEWEKVGLDQLPADLEPVTIEDLRAAG